MLAFKLIAQLGGSFTLWSRLECTGLTHSLTGPLVKVLPPARMSTPFSSIKRLNPGTIGTLTIKIRRMISIASNSSIVTQCQGSGFQNKSVYRNSVLEQLDFGLPAAISDDCNGNENCDLGGRNIRFSGVLSDNLLACISTVFSSSKRSVADTYTTLHVFKRQLPWNGMEDSKRQYGFQFNTCEIFHVSWSEKCYLKTIFSSLLLFLCNACKETVHVVTSTLPSYFNLK